ncbi:MAG: glycoside hydrolase family 3 N-terminal domain-containing protein [Prochloraceae cyanobacterium]
MNLIFFFAEIFKLIIALSIFCLASIVREPWVVKMRTELLLLLLFLGLGLILLEVWNLRKTPNKLKNFFSFLLIFLAATGSSIALGKETSFLITKQEVLNQNSQRLANLGQHFIVGYWDFEEVKNLVEKQAIGGVFITQRNVYNKTADEIKQEIESLQAIRASQGLSPLWIASDQEGGNISRLSPPLTKLSTISNIIGKEKNPNNKKQEIIEYTTKKGQELADIGVNLNFAPVVDLNKGIIDPTDRYSRIYDRAISKDKKVVTKVALWYCDTLSKLNIRCTLKHFPGLGRVEGDTHLKEVNLDASITELNADDWLPFRTIMNFSDAFIMLSHVKLTALDGSNPVSFSNKVVKGLIRERWKYDGVLITDDFCMEAVYGSKDGIKVATVKAINAGVDLILISHDPSQYYPAMKSLLIADRIGNINYKLLDESKVRLERNKKVLFVNRSSQ